MEKPLVIDGECDLCGLPGIIGMTCAECGGTIINVTDTKPVPKDDGRYSEDDLTKDGQTVSLEALAEDEVANNQTDHEDL